MIKIKIFVTLCDPHGLYSPWNSPGQNTGVGSRSLLQETFPTQGSNPGLPHCKQILYHLRHKGKQKSKSHWIYSLQSKMEKLYTVSKNKTRSWLWLRSCAKFRLKLKKVGKTTRPFRYALNQIPYDYTVEVTNRFKGLDLIDTVPEEKWMRKL